MIIKKNFRDSGGIFWFVFFAECLAARKRSSRVIVNGEVVTSIVVNCGLTAGRRGQSIQHVRTFHSLCTLYLRKVRPLLLNYSYYAAA